MRYNILPLQVSIEPIDDGSMDPEMLKNYPRTEVAVVVDPNGNYIEISQIHDDMDFALHKVQIDYDEWGSVDNAVRLLMNAHPNKVEDA